MATVQVAAGPAKDAVSQNMTMPAGTEQEQGIVMKGDGFWCELCSKGPMTSRLVMQRHIDGQSHKRKLMQPDPGQLPGGVVVSAVQAGITWYRCEFCDNSMNSLTVVLAHMESKRHLNKVAARGQGRLEIPALGPLTSSASPALAADGRPPATTSAAATDASALEVSADSAEPLAERCMDGGGADEEGIAQRKDGFWCEACSSGPMTSPVVVQRHLQGQQHQKTLRRIRGVSGASVPTVKQAPADPFESGRWNLPDYVLEDNGSAVCTLCDVRATALLQMQMHLGGDKHAKKCNATGNEALFFVREKGRLEIRASREPALRTGFQSPEEGQVSIGTQATTAAGKTQGSTEEQVSKGAQATTAAGKTQGSTEVNPATVRLLPPGWTSLLDEASGGVYYVDQQAGISQWEPPPPYIPGDWTRTVNEGGWGTWYCSRLQLSFSEHDSGVFERCVDLEGRMYWSGATAGGIRFFEKDVDSSS
eukprot:TRINITY_DN8200_c0_g1_i2.p1 TRINITY_DN8200_c0_g1~~TRINITY_DN8200_c0_g1_i2.p1  ORF type:complete len:519 (+),score=97.58 TRINITY_DN8200_c0_g1_i2:125-1558(+)